jgi:hypothetical protein
MFLCLTQVDYTIFAIENNTLQIPSFVIVLELGFVLICLMSGWVCYSVQILIDYSLETTGIKDAEEKRCTV